MAKTTVLVIKTRHMVFQGISIRIDPIETWIEIKISQWAIKIEHIELLIKTDFMGIMTKTKTTGQIINIEL